jgi:glycosyltransferase involved in cell wall biosynthesis
MTDKKIKILTLSDHPLSPSGVGTQTKYIIEGMLATGKYQFVSLGGAVKHEDYRPTKTEQWEDDWLIFPVDGYGTPDQVRSAVRQQRPDIVWFMTDPRFWGWLWSIENEIRSLVPMVYYHVWDNFPYPEFNSGYYKSNDYVACISKVTHNIVETLTPEVPSSYVPHAVNTNIFRKLDDETITQLRAEHFKEPGRMIFFWNNRNARRKQSGALIWWFKEFLDVVGHDKASLVMHTDTRDPHGQDLEAIINRLGLTNGEVQFSKNKVPPEHLSMMYNMSDCTLNIADAEGFGLATLESLATETPIIVTMTGGLQEQVTKCEKVSLETMIKRNKTAARVTQYEHGFGIEPSSKSIIGSLDVPYIYEDRLNGDKVVDALVQFYNLSQEERRQMGTAGRQHVMENYNFDTFIKQWDEVFTSVHEHGGCWETRKNYKAYSFKEVA